MIETSRAIGAAGPAPDEQSLRRAYLDLVKLCLCDLGAPATRTVTLTKDHRVFTRELTGEDQLGWRIEGKDWPQEGLSMIGLLRLDDLQRCVESVVADRVPGDLIEAGSWRGGAGILMRATLDALGASDRTVWIADSFQGFPAPDDTGSDADRELEREMSAIGYLAPSLEQVSSYFERFGCRQDVEFVPGFFEETMASLRGRTWSLVRLDADTYKATRLALEALYPALSVGGYLVIDDYFHPFLPSSCRRAVDEFRAEHGIAEAIEQVEWNSARWRRENAGFDAGATPAGLALDAPSARAIAGRGGDGARIPTDREQQLSDEIAALGGRLAQAEEELARLRRPTVRAALGWARRRARQLIGN